MQIVYVKINRDFLQKYQRLEFKFRNFSTAMGKISEMLICLSVNMRC